MHDIGRDGVKFKQGDFESGFKLKTGQQPERKPLITEIGERSKVEIQNPKIEEQIAVPFSWADAQRIEFKPQVIMQGDHVFINIPFKGYNKDQDIRYALSSDELLIEVRELQSKGPHKIRRLC